MTVAPAAAEIAVVEPAAAPSGAENETSAIVERQTAYSVTVSPSATERLRTAAMSAYATSPPGASAQPANVAPASANELGGSSTVSPYSAETSGIEPSASPVPASKRMAYELGRQAAYRVACEHGATSREFMSSPGWTAGAPPEESAQPANVQPALANTHSGASGACPYSNDAAAIAPSPPFGWNATTPQSVSSQIAWSVTTAPSSLARFDTVAPSS